MKKIILLSTILMLAICSVSVGQTIPKAGIGPLVGATTYPTSDTVKSTGSASKSYAFNIAGQRDLLGVQVNVAKYAVNTLSGYVTLYSSIDTGATWAKITSVALKDTTAGVYISYYFSYNWNQSYGYKVVVNTAAADSFVIRAWKAERQ